LDQSNFRRNWSSSRLAFDETCILDISSALQNMIHMCVNTNLNFHKNFCHIVRNLLRVGNVQESLGWKNVKPFQEQIKGNPLRVYKKEGHDWRDFQDFDLSIEETKISVDNLRQMI
jgi:hypothetical protein